MVAPQNGGRAKFGLKLSCLVCLPTLASCQPFIYAHRLPHSSGKGYGNPGGHVLIQENLFHIYDALLYRLFHLIVGTLVEMVLRLMGISTAWAHSCLCILSYLDLLVAHI